jgi:ubiquinone/menaquinone biosynthesis C-methylase UbiE
VGIYSDQVFPWLVDRVMARDVMTEQRQVVLGKAYGDVLEIGFGTGLNLSHYPGIVEQLTVLDPNPGMHRRAAGRIAASRIPVHSVTLGADGALPLADNRFDTVVSTWTMCSIIDLERALLELYRVLKPGGSLLFIEHGLSPDRNIARWQNWLTPANKLIADGCHLNRNIAQFVTSSPLSLVQCDQFYLRGTHRIGGWMYRGQASKQAG